MKISQKQASLLAKEIVSQLQKKKVHRVTESFKAQLKSFMDKRAELMQIEKQAEETRQKHDNTLKKLVGPGVAANSYWSMDKIIEKVEEKNIPTVTEIEDEIMLKSMFKSDGDMETFINSIVKKYEKKLQAKILSN